LKHYIDPLSRRKIPVLQTLHTGIHFGKFSTNQGDTKMAREKDIAIHTARRFVTLLKTHGIDVCEAYVFGSAISNQLGPDSDIDVAVVSGEFSGIPYYDVKKISKYRRSIDLRLEIHPFSLDDVTKDPPSFLLDTRKKGVRIN
jgi:hypothetical protein